MGADVNARGYNENTPHGPGEHQGKSRNDATATGGRYRLLTVGLFNVASLSFTVHPTGRIKINISAYPAETGHIPIPAGKRGIMCFFKEHADERVVLFLRLSSLLFHGFYFQGDLFPALLFHAVGTFILAMGQIFQFTFHFPVVFQPAP